ncbi:thioredoxin-like protein [Schizothecium vesticola]|uniref:Thioredoxin-like protein n=1 Tax=Schizothecium vesticola TaxID=314040 RepID=A0AA40FB25_9PEZI|nr:thioredoxin-like protein [Schizothecium vesticola]
MSFIFRRLFSTTSPTMSEAAQEKVKQLIADNGVVVFSKTYCPYCQNTKRLLDGYGAKYAAYELDKESNSDLQDALFEITGQRTVPNIYINKQHIGGDSDFQAVVKNGKDGKNIEELLQAAGAI